MLIWLFIGLLIFKKNYKIIAIDLSKQQAIDADRRAIQPINFTLNLDLNLDTKILLFLKKQRNCLGLFTRNCKSIANVL